jgi:Domain of Unknown Function with PDB structure (DUF3857)
MKTCWLWAVVLTGCAHTFAPLDLKKVPTAKDHPGAQYVVLLDETRADFVVGASGAPEVIETSRRRLKILQPSVLPSLQLSYTPSFTTVERIDARIVKADGTEEPLDQSKKRDVAALDDGVLVTDQRVVIVPIPALPVGAIYDEEIVTRRFDVKPWVLFNFFGDQMPVELSRVIVTTPQDWLIRWSVVSPDGKPFAPTEALEGERKVWTFTREHLAATEPDVQGPPLWAVLPNIAVRLEEWKERGETKNAFATPEKLSSWLAEQYAAQAQVSPELVTTVKEVLAGVPDEPEAKARALYEHVCRTIQYCAIEIGYGGWIPHASPAVQKVRYGDCKDKATYLHALLKVANVSSAPTLIYSHQGTARPFLLPSLGANFNHAILAIDLPGDRVVYADPTERAVPFGELPPRDQGATVLELRPKGAELKRTPESNPATNVIRQRMHVQLDALGDGEGTVRLEALGAHALPIKSRLLQGTGLLREWFDNQLWARSSYATDAKATVPGDFATEVSMEGGVKVRHVLARGPQGDGVLRGSDLMRGWVGMWASRTTDIVWRFAETRVAVVELDLPAGSQVQSLPTDTKIESQFGTYSVKWLKTERGVSMERTFIRKSRIVPVASLEDFNAFAWKCTTADYAPVIVKLPASLEASR